MSPRLWQEPLDQVLQVRLDAESERSIRLTSPPEAVAGLLVCSQLGCAAERAIWKVAIEGTSIMTTPGFITGRFELCPSRERLTLLVHTPTGGLEESTVVGTIVSRIAVLAKVVE